MEPQVISDAIRRSVDTGELVVERKGRQKVFDLSHTLPKESVVTDHEDGALVTMTIRIGPEGSLRPEQFIARVLDGSPGPPETVVTRTDLLIEEGSEWRSPL